MFNELEKVGKVMTSFANETLILLRGIYRKQNEAVEVQRAILRQLHIFAVAKNMQMVHVDEDAILIEDLIT